jgi:hypothetical protein
VVEHPQAGRVVTEAAVIKERLEPLIQEAAVVETLLVLLRLEAQAALALSSLKYLTTYPQHFLVA